MRALIAVLALLSFLAGPARAVPFVVDAVNHVVETSTIKIQFGTDCPERIVALWYKPYTTATVNLEALPWEFSGQMIQGLWVAQGPIFSQATDTTGRSWRVIAESPTRLVVRIESHSTWPGQPNPSVRTDYTFFADSSCYAVERTVFFSAQPWSNTSLQPYVLRIKQGLGPALRYRNSVGTVTSGSFCGGGCSTSDWDHRWAMVQGVAFAATIHYAATNPLPVNLMGDNDTNSASNWTGPLTPTGNFTTDVTWRLLVHFSTTPTNYALEDSVQAWFDGLATLDVPATLAPVGLGLAVAPNPAPLGARVRFALSAAGDVDLAVFDLAGRRVATLARGALAAGPHEAFWDGTDASGRPTGAAVYFVRLSTAHGAMSRRFVRVR